MTGLRLVGVRRRYRGGGEVLADIDLHVDPGRPVVVLGANGSGKSSLLRIAAGAASPTSGRVTGRPDGLGYLPPHAHTTSRMTAGAWLAHRLRMRGTPDADPRPVLDALGADPALLAGPLRALSTGNLRRVALAAALAGPPPLAVLDEPWNGLDAAAAPALTRLLGVLAPAVGLLVADHSGHAAALPSPRALRLDGGRLVPAELVARRAVTVVVLRPPTDEPDPLPALLRDVPSVLSHAERDGAVALRVPAEDGDTLLAAALARGLSVVRVEPEDGP